MNQNDPRLIMQQRAEQVARAGQAAQAATQFAQQNGGEIARHSKDVLNLGPTSMQLNLVEFYCDVSAGGVITQPAKKNLPGGFKSDLYELRGFLQAPATDPGLAALITFSIRNHDVSGDLFSTPISMANLVDPLGGGAPFTFPRGMYVFAPGANVEVKFAVEQDAAIGYAVVANAAKRWGLTLCMNLIAA